MSIQKASVGITMMLAALAISACGTSSSPAMNNAVLEAVEPSAGEVNRVFAYPADTIESISVEQVDHTFSCRYNPADTNHNQCEEVVTPDWYVRVKSDTQQFEVITDLVGGQNSLATR
jgi:hypothetical protein